MLATALLTKPLLDIAQMTKEAEYAESRLANEVFKVLHEEYLRVTDGFATNTEYLQKAVAEALKNVLKYYVDINLLDSYSVTCDDSVNPMKIVDTGLVKVYAAWKTPVSKPTLYTVTIGPLDNSNKY